MFDFLTFISANMQARTLFVIELLAAEILLLCRSPHRSHFALRVLLAILLYCAFGFGFPESLFNMGAYVTYPIFFVSLLASWFCIDCSFKQILLCCSTAYGLQGLVTQCSAIIRLVFPVNAVWRPLVDLGCCVVIYAVGAFFFLPRYRNEKLNLRFGTLMILCLTVLLTADFMSKLVNSQDAAVTVVSRVSLSISIILALCFQYNVLVQEKLRTVNEQMELMLKSQKEQYRLSSEVIALVNMKCHDLKQQIADLRSVCDGAKNELTDDVVTNMEQSISFYEKVAKTGNLALDCILTEKSLFCEQHSILFTYMGNTEKLSKLKPSDCYSLLHNALDNAVESVMKIEDPALRYIFLNIGSRENVIIIHIENYCAVHPSFQDELPVTTKADKQNHGIGVYSMRYLAQKYGGNVVFGMMDDLFMVDIILPVGA